MHEIAQKTNWHKKISDKIVNPEEKSCGKSSSQHYAHDTHAAPTNTYSLNSCIRYLQYTKMKMTAQSMLLIALT